jgi:O-antigen ligase
MVNRAAFGALCLLVFTIPFSEVIVIPGMGTLTRFIGYGALALAALGVIERGDVRPLHGAALPAFLFVGWAALSLSWTDWPEVTAERLPTFVRCLGLFWILYEYVDSPDRVRAVLTAYLCGALIAVGGVMEARETQQVLDDSEYARYALENVDPNDLATLLALGIPMAWYLVSVRPLGVLERWIPRIYLPAGVIGILLTGSRGGLLATCGASLYPLSSLWRQPLRIKLAALGGFLLAGLGALFFVPSNVLARFATIPEEFASGTLSLRPAIWRAGFRLLGDHPVRGVGAGAFAYELFGRGGFAKPRVAHNAILGVLFELGVVGCMLFIGIIAVSFVYVRRLAVNEKRVAQFLLLTWLIGTASLSWEYQKATWLIFGLVAGMCLHLGREDRELSACQ